MGRCCGGRLGACNSCGRGIRNGWFPLGATSRARDRLGEAPLKMLFERVTVPLAVAGTPGALLGKRRLLAIDG